MKFLANKIVMIKLCQVVLLCFLTFRMFGQHIQADSSLTRKDRRFKYASFIIPSSLILYGVVGLESQPLKTLNQSTRGEFGEHIDEKFSIDDFSQYSPFLGVYGLNAFGIKGKHNLADRTEILGTAYLIMGLIVNIVKWTGPVERPDSSSNNSFPSGHTATAFMGAEFLFQEYNHNSVWYGITGYVVAAGTGFFRMYNNRHWLTDVAAGAGIGLLSTKLAYLVYPYLKRKVFKGKSKSHSTATPFINGRLNRLGIYASF